MSKLLFLNKLSIKPGIVVSSDVAPYPNIVEPPIMKILNSDSDFSIGNSLPLKPKLFIVIDSVF